jgi:SAM-dependent MidA family methyltransferase
MGFGSDDFRAANSLMTLDEVIAERVRRVGPIPFDEFMELALYHPEFGFYSAGRGAGRGGDFLTSPHVGPLYGAVIARALDEWWDELANPDPFTVIEAGAGDGSLARDVLVAAPRCSAALRYLLVEQSSELRALQQRQLHLEPTRLALGPVQDVDDDEGPRPVRGSGPLAASLSELPAEPIVGVVFANELLDNLPVRLLERGVNGWLEVRVGEALTEVLVPAAEDLAKLADRFAPHAAVGARVPIQERGGSWLRHALATVDRGRVVVVDYADTTAAMAARDWPTWLRTYAAHGRGGHPLEVAGSQDITCDVAVDQLASTAAPSGDRSQAEFLSAHGLDKLADAARAQWRAGAASGDLESLKARSRVTEAAALMDPNGLGAFRVLEWDVGPAGRRNRRG